MANPMPTGGASRVLSTKMNPEQAVRICKKWLKDPLHPPVCALPLLIPAYSFLDGKNGKTATDIVWPTVIWFLTAKRTTEQFRQFRLEFNTCQCPESTDANCKMQHEVGRKIFSDRYTQVFGQSIPQAMTPFHCLMHALFGGLLEYLRTLGVTRTAKGGTDVWPKTPADLLPHGAVLTIQSLEQWLEYFRDPAAPALSLLAELARICRTLIVPSMVASPKLAGLVVTTMREACQEAQHRMDAPWFSPQTVEAVANAFKGRILQVQYFLTVFSTTRTNGALITTETSRFWGDNDKPFFEWANVVLQLLTQSRLFPPHSQNDLEFDSGIRVLQEVTADMFLRVKRRYGMSRDALDPEQLLSDPRQAIRAHLISLKTEERCAKIGCTESLQTSSKLQRCSRCQVLCWCSKEHQKSTWNDPRCPHREVCNLMAQVVEAAGGDLDNFETFKRRIANISLADVIQMGAWLDRFSMLRDIAYETKGVFEILSSHLQHNGCSAVGCPKGNSATQCDLNKCSGCGIFQYCWH
ncbi:hypothetical protein FB451DRAFT_1233963 [Mycena latifolia]|nr:hypothetical protein FB451DRAFT_1233963 [Mycena latifolia]